MGPVSDLFAEPEDATPLTPEERDALLPSWISHRSDLNEAEEDNILSGARWARGRRSRRPIDLLDERFIRALHGRMLGNVWRWAGRYRDSARNIGVEAFRIPVDMAALVGDARYWVEHSTYPPDELAVRFHHRLVAIHPFPNGNGRHARLMADLLVERLGGEAFGWGSGSITDAGELRARYIAALRAADRHEIGLLLAFARS